MIVYFLHFRFAQKVSRFADTLHVGAADARLYPKLVCKWFSIIGIPENSCFFALNEIPEQFLIVRQ